MTRIIYNIDLKQPNKAIHKKSAHTYHAALSSDYILID